MKEIAYVQQVKSHLDQVGKASASDIRKHFGTRINMKTITSSLSNLRKRGDIDYDDGVYISKSNGSVLQVVRSIEPVVDPEPKEAEAPAIPLNHLRTVTVDILVQDNDLDARRLIDEIGEFPEVVDARVRQIAKTKAADVGLVVKFKKTKPSIE
jgi:hypothetical protein